MRDNNLSITDAFFEQLFRDLYFSPTESDVEKVIQKYPDIFKQENWAPYGDNQNFFGAIENQQASPIPALVEKITNSIDAILMRKCYESGIPPKSSEAPKSMEEAVQKFFKEYKNWDLPKLRKHQSENVQIIADGPRKHPSLLIYDDGEGQQPEDFEDTFLSLFRDNKNEIHFVQGKYNMGGSGAIIFCGKNKYQLIASKRYDRKGKFGFTLIRRHPLSEVEESTKRNTWYEYLKLNGEIPAFDIDTMDLGLYNRQFKTGTLIKLYSYDLPSGSRSVISRDLNQSLNEYLFEPALPIITIDKKERYPDDKNLERDLYGLKRRLEEDANKYVEEYFVEEFTNKEIGEVRITCYVFKTRIEGKSVKESKQSIRREFFKNNMSVLFSLNGQVHGHYTSEFITRSLKFELLKNYVLIHVDCTQMRKRFRDELFMASRDRLKDGDESRKLREILADTLKRGRLNEIYKKRKDFISVDAGDAQDLLKSFTKNLPLNNDLVKLLGQTFRLEEREPKRKNLKTKDKRKEIKISTKPFNPQRFPSYFKLGSKSKEGEPVTEIPLGGDRTIKFSTDVENEYFVRVAEPGELKLAIVGCQSNNETKNGKTENSQSIEHIFDVVKKSPNDGTIKVILSPTQDVSVGDAVKIKATLTSPGKDFNHTFWVKISSPEKPKKPSPRETKNDDEKLGLPEYVLVYRENLKTEGEKERMTWEKFEENGGVEMSYHTVVHPFVEGDTLEKIFINMDSSVLKEYKSKCKSEDSLKLADNRYIAAVYFHTLFLYTISKSKKYTMHRMEGEQEVLADLSDYIKDIFENYYSQFLLNFEMNQLIESLNE
jgi:hypothetical protein